MSTMAKTIISSHLLFLKNGCQMQLCTKFIQVYNADIGIPRIKCYSYAYM